ncbi:MAG: hypothetical protein IH804_04260 [Planctomycetes bacterium]|nr:hypothetical protein [Planctomycetota bacterium]
MLAFAPMHNSHGKRDATGAFIPEATRFIMAAAVGSRLVLFDNSKPFAARRREVLREIPKHKDLDAVAFFCHGSMKSIQAGFGMRSARLLAYALSLESRSDFLVVPLYCCSTGDDPDDDPITAAGTGEGSFADKLRDELCGNDIKYTRVMGHTTVAHTTKNPHVVFFDGMGTPEGVEGGYAPVKPGTKSWGPWRRGLRSGDLRYRFPFMTPGEIHAELSA